VLVAAGWGDCDIAEVLEIARETLRKHSCRSHRPAAERPATALLEPCRVGCHHYRHRQEQAPA
jgi:hypothetical protein